MNWLMLRIQPQPSVSHACRSHILRRRVHRYGEKGVVEAGVGDCVCSVAQIKHNGVNGILCIGKLSVSQAKPL